MIYFWALTLLFFTLLMLPLIGTAFVIGLIYRALRVGFVKGYRFVDFVIKRV